MIVSISEYSESEVVHVGDIDFTIVQEQAFGIFRPTSGKRLRSEFGGERIGGKGLEDVLVELYSIKDRDFPEDWLEER